MRNAATDRCLGNLFSRHFAHAGDVTRLFRVRRLSWSAKPKTCPERSRRVGTLVWRFALCLFAAFIRQTSYDGAKNPRRVPNFGLALREKENLKLRQTSVFSHYFTPCATFFRTHLENQPVSRSLSGVEGCEKQARWRVPFGSAQGTESCTRR